MPGAGISGEFFSRRSCPTNLSFTLRLSHSQSQNGDSALIRTTALKVTAALAVKMCVLTNNQRQQNIWSREAECGPVQPQGWSACTLSVIVFTDLILCCWLNFLPSPSLWCGLISGLSRETHTHTSAFIHYWSRRWQCQRFLSQRELDQTIIMSCGLV